MHSSQQRTGLCLMCQTAARAVCVLSPRCPLLRLLHLLALLCCAVLCPHRMTWPMPMLNTNGCRRGEEGRSGGGEE